MSPATRSLPCMNALVPSSSPLTIFSNVSRLTEIVQSAFFPAPSLTEFGVDLPSMRTLPASPKSNLSVPPSPELGPIAGPICEIICCTCAELMGVLPDRLGGYSSESEVGSQRSDVRKGEDRRRCDGRPARSLLRE